MVPFRRGSHTLRKRCLLTEVVREGDKRKKKMAVVGNWKRGAATGEAWREYKAP